MKFLHGLFCYWFGHRWITTHTNRYLIPTAQFCNRCFDRREWSGGISGGWTP